VRAGILLFVDDLKPRYRSAWGFDQPLASAGLPLEILRARLARIPGIDEFVLLAPAGELTEPLISQARGLGIEVDIYDSSCIQSKPWSASQERWQLESDLGADTWLGTPLAACIGKHRWDRLVFVPLSNLLVDRRGVVESIQLHLREGFDATFSEDRITGANWAIFEGALIAGLQASHPDIMATRGGFAWALREPLYPFKIGEYHAPRNRPRMPVDLRLSGKRAADVFAKCGGDMFAKPEFEYLDWISDSRWEEAYLDFGPLTAYIEPANICAASCLHCPQSTLRRPRGFMASGIFESLSEELQKVEGLRWVFSGMGEPLANPGLGKMAERVKNRHISLYTSLNIEPPTAFPWEVFDLVRISVDALEAGHFNRVRPGCSWERIEAFLSAEAVRKAEAPETRPEIGVSFLKHRENEKSADAFLRYWKQVCTPVFRQKFFIWPTESPPKKVQWFQILGVGEYLGLGEYAGATRYTPLKRRPCLHALLGMHVLQDGTLARCPYDIEGKNGWAAEPDGNSVLQAWKGDEWRSFRREHLEMQFPAGSPCAGCQDWYHRE